MPILSVVLTLIVIGVAMWLVNSYIPMDGRIKQILNLLVVILVIFWILFTVLGLGASSFGNVPRIR